MSGYVLKIIAIVTMLIDHATAILVPTNTMTYLIGRSIGRLAFPIFCFLLVQGLLHTKNIQKYLTRLGLFALISEIPFDLAFSDNTTQWGFLEHQNIFFTLFIGLGVIYLMSIIEKKFVNNIFLSNIFDMLVVLAGSFLAVLLSTDYSFGGILLIVAFYLFRENKLLLTVAVFIVNAYMFGGLQGLATLSMIFIWFYNGQRGQKINKYLFYAFYPVHILILYLISLVI